MTIGVIIRIAFAGDGGDIADRLVLPRLGALLLCAERTRRSANICFFDRPKGYFGFLTS
jgi:hypothetical protein